jgi:hypothetical protein
MVTPITHQAQTRNDSFLEEEQDFSERLIDTQLIYDLGNANIIELNLNRAHPLFHVAQELTTNGKRTLFGRLEVLSNRFDNAMQHPNLLKIQALTTESEELADYLHDNPAAKTIYHRIVGTKALTEALEGKAYKNIVRLNFDYSSKSTFDKQKASQPIKGEISSK